MQNDFIDGALGTKEAVSIVSLVKDKINNWKGDIAITLDTHDDNYLMSNEGKNLPIVHCIRNTHGWKLNTHIQEALHDKQFECFMKPTFGSKELAQYCMNYDQIQFVGICTDICVISNVLLTKAFHPEAEIIVDAACCAGVTKESSDNALKAMQCCHIQVINF